MQKYTKTELFECVPVPRALATMAIPTIISQLINLVYNMVDAFFIGRTGNAYMMAATGVTLTLVMMNVAFANLFGIGGGSLIARLLGQKNPKAAQSVSAFSVWGCIGLALTYSVLLGLFQEPVLRFLGASDDTVGFAESYTLLVIVLGATPVILSQTLSHLLRNTGHSTQASFGLSLGGLLNIALDPLFMFVLLPKGQEVTGAAIATLISNVVACVYLLIAYFRAGKTAPLRFAPWKIRGLEGAHVRKLFAVGVPSAVLTGLFDVANIALNKLASAHSDVTVAAMSIVMKIERIPNAVNIGICQGMLPIVAYNYASGNRERMQQTIRTARWIGLSVAALSIVLLELLAEPASALFMNTSGAYAETAVLTVSSAALFLRIRALASPVQFLNYHSSFCMQAIGAGGFTMLHAFVRELVFYIPLMVLLDHFFGECGLAAALVVGEALGAIFALILLRRALQKNAKTQVVGDS